MPKGSPNPLRFVVWLLVLVLVAFTAVTLYRTGAFTPPARIALVASDESRYWEDAIIGARDAAAEYGAILTVHQASGGEPDQSRILREVAASGVDGIAVSPLNANTQAALLLELGQTTNVVTFDSDSPRSGRLCFVGTNNYTAGRALGKLVREALPDGGTVVISVGSMDKENGRLRRQGVIDELLERPFGPGRPPEPMGEPLAGPSHTVVATLVDENDPVQAKQNIDGMLASGEAPDCIVGLYAYNGPAAVDALAGAGLTDDVVVIGFDYAEETLAAIETGQIYATMAQDPYSYGFHAVEILAKQLDESRSVGSIPITGMLEIPCSVIRSENLRAFRNDLAARRGGSSG
jgi:ribose transport system substrate-binding protein